MDAGMPWDGPVTRTHRYNVVDNEQWNTLCSSFHEGLAHLIDSVCYLRQRETLTLNNGRWMKIPFWLS